MNKPIELPARTAGECTLADGTVVWVQTLNSLQREQVTTACQKHALKVCRPFVKGGDEYAPLRADFRDLNSEDQSAYLAGHEIWMGRVQQAALEAFPDPQEPHKDGSTEEQVQALADWEAACDAADEKRRAHEKLMCEQKKSEALALSARKRVDACMTAAVEQENFKAWMAQHKLETLRRATRQTYDHSAFYFRNTQEVEDASDADRETLLARYYELDTVTARTVPT